MATTFEEGMSDVLRRAEEVIDNGAVNNFSEAMSRKLAQKRAEGRGGWWTESCDQWALSNMLRAHLDKGDPVDVANFCMMLWNRGESITPYAGPPMIERWRFDELAEAARRVLEQLDSQEPPSSAIVDLSQLVNVEP